MYLYVYIYSISNMRSINGVRWSQVKTSSFILKACTEVTLQKIREHKLARFCGPSIGVHTGPIGRQAES